MATVATAFFALAGSFFFASHIDAFVPRDPAVASTTHVAGIDRAPYPRLSVIDPITASSVPAAATTTALRMGLLDSVLSRFGNKEEGDFVKLEDMNEQFFGPGPAVLLYNIPSAIEDDEVMDMLSDGAPTATRKGISLARIATSTTAAEKHNEDLLDIGLGDALEKIVSGPQPPSFAPPAPVQPIATTVSVGTTAAPEQQVDSIEGCPVALFSGFSNTEMMASYNILGEEIYKETASYGAGQYLACATAVPNAMEKPLGQVLSEISGDHTEAMRQADEE
eukprot:CAMPEP_0201240646 /NCGR_PEP_ID=MMETSP0852-20130820/30588_1 /ASSEMBLY_ACC=CAM_ASM_000632 /TAXON_ID=183588 /ORGANISM="Pseudo-nitzschia fraudulenta, Strain WWA7" /LENGTH=278 /DNA_ID=CAMNT_0047536563 /DNA_START=61 /DNA_END=897 /DNA_ORIENTATION=+